jgi:hypothetical protein
MTSDPQAAAAATAAALCTDQAVTVAVAQRPLSESEGSPGS